MPDLTLREVLEQYEPECREVLSERMFDCMFCFPPPLDTPDSGYITHLIGACVQWLAEHYCGLRRYPKEPLRFFLSEVRAHMEGQSDG